MDPNDPVNRENALLAPVDTSGAIAQTAGSPNPAAPPSTNPDNQLVLNSAPVGHRQPRAKIGRKLGIGTSVAQRVFKQKPLPA